MTKRLRGVALLVLVNLAVFCVLALLLEGAATLALNLREGPERADLAERLHTVYDAELGWVNIPGTSRPGMYGPGIDLSINPQGFRGTTAVTPHVQPGTVRVVCSGDSFTLGFGVADTSTWCHRLGALDPRLETVNMGQGGYGFDQAILWYRRDGMPLEHHVQVLAFISDDFRRMEEGHFLGYPKPLLTMVGDSLHVAPAPRSGRGGIRAFLARFADPIDSLRTVELLRRIRGRVGTEGAAEGTDEQAARAARNRVRPVVATLVAQLVDWHRQNGSRLLLVHLPTSYELDGFVADIAEEWSEFVGDLAEQHGIGYLDLFPVFRGYDPSARAALFIDGEVVDFPAAAGHYTPEGNRLVAEEVHSWLGHEGWLGQPPPP